MNRDLGNATEAFSYRDVLVPPGMAALPVLYLSSSSNPFDPALGSQAHFFLCSAALQRKGGISGSGFSDPYASGAHGSPDFIQAPLYIALLDPARLPHGIDVNTEAKRPVVAGMSEYTSSVLHRSMDIATVRYLVLRSEDYSRLRSGSARPPAPPELAALPPSEVLALLPLLLTAPQSPIVFALPFGTGVLEHMQCTGQRIVVTQAQAASRPIDSPQFVTAMRCQLVPSSLFQRATMCPAVQSLLYRRAYATSILNGSSPTDVAGGQTQRDTDGDLTAATRRRNAVEAKKMATTIAMTWWAFVLYAVALPPDKREALFTRSDFRRSFARYRSMISGSALSRGSGSDSDDETGNTPGELDAKIRAYRLTIAAGRRTLLLTVDTSAGAAALQDFHSQVVVSTLQSTIRETLYQALGAVSDLFGARMSYRTDWTLLEHPDLGASMRTRHFGLLPEVVMLDGNRYGVTPLPVYEARKQWERRVHLDPVVWRFKAFPPRLRATIALVGQRIGVLETDLQLFSTLHHAMATVLRSLPLLPGDTMLVFGPCDHRAIVHHISMQKGVIAHIAKLLEPLEDDSGMVLQFKQCLDATGAKVALVQHLQPTGRVLPVARFAAECREANCVLVVDGTDALGNLDFALGQIGADFYISRLDGYFFCPIGTSVLYANPGRQAALSTLTVSYFHGQGYATEWTYTGLIDMTAWVAILQAMQFQQFLCAGYQSYLVYLANEAHKLLCTKWRVQPVAPTPLRSGVFSVLLPGFAGTSDADALHFQAVLAKQARVHVGVIDIGFQDGTRGLAARVTCTVYTDMNDIKRLALAVLENAVESMQRARAVSGPAYNAGGGGGGGVRSVSRPPVS